ncbi:hypothetical protein [Nonomuraea cavernae]|nr:hypothetical protein [Nonomuraea cavernae]
MPLPRMQPGHSYVRADLCHQAVERRILSSDEPGVAVVLERLYT